VENPTFEETLVESRTVVSGADLEAVRRLFEEYAQWVAIDLSFQGFADEVAGLPGEYVAPHGTLLLCLVEGAAAGCVSVRPWQAVACEMKRLYVREAFQGRGCGLFLARRAIEWAKRAGYHRMLLDTLPTMTAAQRLYEGLGFREVPPYRFNPVPGARYMELPLVSPGKSKSNGLAGR
jgi:GNAT superfamily N-acetyltransferase